jgi:uncharacterized protein (TIGR03067 family)
VTLLEDEIATGTGNVAVPETGPKAIDVITMSGPGWGQVLLGIYEVVGDGLTLCIGGERPSEFSGAGLAALMELQRVPPHAS